jgi:ABC-type glycerol-3-phosphate transport system substrate-binding protein
MTKTPISRHGLLQSEAGAAAAMLCAPALAATSKRSSFLAWNIIDQEPMIRGWIKRFVALWPGVEAEWLDRKGLEIPTLHQTQLVAGTPPDVINTQGALGLEYAAQGALLDLTPRLQAEAGVLERFNADYLSTRAFEGSTSMLPFYITRV